MRQIGTVSAADEAEVFHDFLLSQGIASRVEEEDETSEWSVWIINEDHVADARTELERFRQNPAAPQYAEAAAKAEAIRRDEARREKAIRKKAVDIRRRWDQPLWKRIPVTVFLIAASVTTVALTTNWSTPLDMGDALKPVGRFLFITDYVVTGREIRYPGLEPVWSGQIWRLVTPIFLHFGPLHILFNMLWLHRLGMSIELRRGSWKMAWFVLLIAISSNIAQYLHAGPNFGGMSGVVFGLFGYIWMQSKFDPFSGFYMPPNLVFLMIAWFFLCTTGYVGSVANMAHGVGLAVGAALGVAAPLLRKLR